MLTGMGTGRGRPWLGLLVALTMVAFAANSVFNRMALVDGETGALGFAALRLAAGALCLALLVGFRDRRRLRLAGPGRAVGVLSLLAYMLGFSLAYLSLDAGIGALILFGAVQLTMFAGALLAGERPPLRHWLGAGVALAGLAWLSWPQEGVETQPWPAAAMLLAGVGWGVYSLAGRRAGDALAATAANFVLAAPVAIVAALVAREGLPGARGAALAVASGAITSALGYALWYAILPRMASTVAAVAQLTVPVIAMAGGVLLLGESVGLRFAVAAVLVLGGVLLTVTGNRRPDQRTSRSSGS